jgi:hypothetical protein
MEMTIPLRVNLRIDFDPGEHDVEGLLENSRCEIFLERADVPVLSVEITDWEKPGEYE